MERLSKYIARCGVTSRRKAEELITDGLVRVNGKVVDVLGAKIDPEADAVKVKNKLVSLPQTITLLFHKPKGVITTKADTHGRKTVLDFLPKHYHDVHPVGRLDKDTTGLLILTNDGDLTYQLTHPKHSVTKTYSVEIDGFLNARDIQKIQRGIHLKEGRTLPAEMTVHKRVKGHTLLTLKIREGKKRQIRRMFEALGLNVVALRRIAIGSLRVEKIDEGLYRHMTKKEIALLLEGQ